MYTEVCARAEEVIYRGENYNCSPCFYTWKETKDYAWDYSETSWNDYVVMEGETGDHVNAKSVLQQGDDYMGKGGMLKSNNAWLNGNDYRKEDYTQSSGLNVIGIFAFPFGQAAHFDYTVSGALVHFPQNFFQRRKVRSYRLLGVVDGSMQIGKQQIDKKTTSALRYSRAA